MLTLGNADGDHRTPFNSGEEEEERRQPLTEDGDPGRADTEKWLSQGAGIER